MNTKELAKMINDKHFFDLKKMQYKYSPESVEEMMETLKEMSYAPIALKDFDGQPCRYLPAQSLIPTSVMKKLLAANTSKESFGLKAMEEEIESTLQIENIQSNRDSGVFKVGKLHEIFAVCGKVPAGNHDLFLATLICIGTQQRFLCRYPQRLKDMAGKKFANAAVGIAHSLVFTLQRRKL